MRYPVFGAALVALLFLAACSSEASMASNNDTSNMAPETVQMAERIYSAGNAQGATACQSCHSLDGTPLVGPSFQGVGLVAGERRPSLDAEAYLRESITHPNAYLVEGYSNAMPANYGETLSDEEIDALVEWMLTFNIAPEQ